MATARELVDQYNQELLACLPMDNSTFLETLVEKCSLSDEEQSLLKEIADKTEKSSYFLDRIIIPRFDDGSTTHFTDVLAAMEESSHDNVKALAKEIQNKLGMKPNEEDYNSLLGN